MYAPQYMLKCRSRLMAVVRHAIDERGWNYARWQFANLCGGAHGAIRFMGAWSKRPSLTGRTIEGA
jgi:hypothetical protein